MINLKINIIIIIVFLAKCDIPPRGNNSTCYDTKSYLLMSLVSFERIYVKVSDRGEGFEKPVLSRQEGHF